MAAYPPINRSFFGGAIQACLPVGFRDLSVVRQVPDEQECWHEPESDELFVMECLELDASRDIQAAAENYWSDLCITNESSQQDIASFSFAVRPDAVRRLPDSAIVGCGVGNQRVKMGRAVMDYADGSEHQQEERNVRVELCVIRLPPVKTDLLLTLSTPRSTMARRDDGSAPSAAFAVILSTLQITDWSLFG